MSILSAILFPFLSLQSMPLPHLFFLLLSTIIVALVLFHLFTIRPRQSNRKLPPEPPRLPLLGHLHLLGRLPHRSLQKLSSIHGPIMLLHLGHVPTVVISSASIVKEAIHLHDISLSNRPHSINADILAYGSSSVPFTQYGEYWRQARRVYAIHMLSVKQVDSFRQLRREEVALLVARIHKDGSSGEKPINLSKLLIDFTNGFACRAAFGQKYPLEGGNSIEKLMEEVVELLLVTRIGEFIPWLSWIDWLRGLDKRAKATASILDRFLEVVIRQHIQKRRNNCENDMKKTEANNFIDVLLDVEKNDGGINMENIKVFLWDMILAGTDTVYVAMEWAMAELIRHPQEMERAQQEIRRTVHTCGEMNEESIGKMSYLKAVISETLRLHAVVPILVPRETDKEIQLLGYDIPAKTRVIINAWAIGRDPECWGERATEFWPQRFLDSPIDQRGQEFEFIPFGVGRRGCPGTNFATRIMELAIANLLYHFDWKLDNNNKTTGEESVDMREKAGITVHLQNNLVVVAEPYVKLSETT